MFHKPILTVALIVLSACGKKDDPEPNGKTFPADFLWGSATAGFQVDMGCPTLSAAECDDTASDWYDWVTDPDIVAEANMFVSGDPVSMGPGMWELLEQDADQMKADGHNSYRMSLEWSRLFPTRVPDSAASVDELVPLANPAAVARYHEMFAALRDRGIEPMVTVNHYVLPRWIHDGLSCHIDLETCVDRGWMDRDRMVHHAGLFAGFVGREFGDDVDMWLTLNEPYATTLSGYLQPGESRSAPPGVVFDTAATRDVMLNQIDGHAAMYDALHAEDPTAEVGIVMNLTAIVPRDPEVENDVRGAEHMDYLYHELYMQALLDGAWDADLDGIPETTRPELANRLDFLGINYYNRVEVAGFPFGIAEEVPIFDFLPEFSWEPYPEGLGEVIARAGAWNLPIYVTENGTPYVEDDGVEVLEGHLDALWTELDGGADVRGYFYWSWVDNYEWNHGFDLRFGLYELDVVTKERIQRPVGERYSEIAISGTLK